MYSKILVALDNSNADQVLLPHVKELARLTKAELLLIHVADGWVAQWQHHLDLADSPEIREDQAYLDKISAELHHAGISVTTVLSKGTPSLEILKVARAHACDLIAMTTHGHKFLADLLLGSTIEKVRHESEIPLLLVSALDRPTN